MSTTTAAPSKLETRLFINGEWINADSGRTLGVINPATEEVIAEVAYGGRAETKRAVTAAHRAMKDWMHRTVYERAKVLKKTAELMRDRADAIARTMTLEQGKPLAEAKGEVLHSADTFEWFAEEGKRAYGQVIPPSQPGKRHLVIKHPVGVVGAISPWNFPITLQARKIAPALAAGCTIVCKPASQTPLCLIQTFQCMVDAGLPPGVANLVIGPAQEIADELLENPAVRKISFTGSTEVGKQPNWRRQGERCESAHRRRALQAVPEGLLLRADRADRPAPREQDARRGAVRAGHAGARFQETRRGHRRGEQHALRPRGLRLHE